MGSATKAGEAATKASAQASQGFARFSGTLSQGVSGLRDMALGLAAVTAGATLAVRQFAQFEQETDRIITLVGVAEDQVKQWTQSLLEMAPAVGRGPTELARALFVVTSAGIRSAEALTIVEQAAKASVIGLGDTATIARTVTAAMQAWGPAALSAERATEILVATVREGNLEAASLAGSMGRVFGIAAEVGISFEEVGAFIATFTRVGVSAEEAVTALRGTIISFLKPGKEARDTLEALGISVEGLRKSIRERGLNETMRELLERLKGVSEEALAAVIPNIRALAGSLAVFSRQGEESVVVLKSIKDSAGILASGFARASKDLDFSFDRLKANVEVVAIAFGQALAPALNDVLLQTKPLLDLVLRLVQVFAALPDPVKQVAILVVALSGALAGVGFVAGTFLRGIMALTPLLGALAGILGGPLGLVALFGSLGLAGALVLTARDADTATTAGRGLKDILLDIAAGAREASSELRDLPSALQEIERHLIGTEGLIDFFQRLGATVRTFSPEILQALRDASPFFDLLLRLQERGQRAREAQARLAADTEAMLAQLAFGVAQSTAAIRAALQGIDEVTKPAETAKEVLKDVGERLEILGKQFELGDVSAEFFRRSIESAIRVLTPFEQTSREARLAILNLRLELEKLPQTVVPSIRLAMEAGRDFGVALKELDLEEAFQRGLAAVEELKKRVDDLQPSLRLAMEAGKDFGETLEELDPADAFRVGLKAVEDFRRELEATDRIAQQLRAEFGRAMQAGRDFGQAFEELDPAEAFKRGQAAVEELRKTTKTAFQQLIEEMTNTSKIMEDLAIQIARNMQRAFSDFFFDLFKGKVTSMQDVFKRALDFMLRAISDFLSAALVGRFLQFLSMQFGFGGVVPGTTGGVVGGPSPAQQVGGTVAQAGASAFLSNLFKPIFAPLAEAAKALFGLGSSATASSSALASHSAGLVGAETAVGTAAAGLGSAFLGLGMVLAPVMLGIFDTLFKHTLSWGDRMASLVAVLGQQIALTQQATTEIAALGGATFHQGQQFQALAGQTAMLAETFAAQPEKLARELLERGIDPALVPQLIAEGNATLEAMAKALFGIDANMGHLESISQSGDLSAQLADKQAATMERVAELLGTVPGLSDLVGDQLGRLADIVTLLGFNEEAVLAVVEAILRDLLPPGEASEALLANILDAIKALELEVIINPPGVGAGLQQGGIVPGAPGQAVPILAHAGELVIPAEITRRLLTAGSAAQGGGIVTGGLVPVGVALPGDLVQVFLALAKAARELLLELGRVDLATDLWREELRVLQEEIDRTRVALETAVDVEAAEKAARDLQRLIQERFDLEIAVARELHEEVERLAGEVERLSQALAGGITTLAGLTLGFAHTDDRLQMFFRDLRWAVEALVASGQPLRHSIDAIVALWLAGLETVVTALERFAAGLTGLSLDTIFAGVQELFAALPGLIAGIQQLFPDDPERQFALFSMLAQGIQSAAQRALAAAATFFQREREAAQEASRARIEALQSEREAAQEASRARIEALTGERQRLQEQAQAQRTALQQSLQLTQAWRAQLEAVTNQLLTLQLGQFAPLDPMVQLGLARAELERTFVAFQREATPELARDLQELATQVLQAGSEVFTRPSPAFRDLFSFVTRMLEQVRDVAAGRARSESELLESLERLETETNTRLQAIDRAIARENDALRATLQDIDRAIARENDALRATLQDIARREELTRFAIQDFAARQFDQLRTAMVEALLKLAEQQAEAQKALEEAQARLQAIIGEGNDFQSFIAQRQTEHLEALRLLHEDFLAVLRALGVIPSAQTGILEVPRDMFVRAHRREMIVPAWPAEALRRGDRGGGGDIVVTVRIPPGAVVIQGVEDPETAAELAMRKLERKLQGELFQKLKGRLRREI